MKKILLLMAAGIMTSSLYAGDINLYSENTLWEPGTHLFNTMNLEGGNGFLSVTIDPKLSIMSNERTFDVQVTAVCTSGQKIQMCAGGQCVKDTKVVKSGLILKPDTPLDLRFEYMDFFESELQIPRNITTELTVEELGVESSKKSYTIVMNGELSKVDVIAHDKEIFLINGQLHYALSGAATLNLYDANGRTVKTAVLEGNGILSLSELPKGIYIYTLSGNNQISGKIIL